jgi:hypothetical protein
MNNRERVTAAPAHATPGDAKPENVAAMIEVLQNQ